MGGWPTKDWAMDELKQELDHVLGKHSKHVIYPGNCNYCRADLQANNPPIEDGPCVDCWPYACRCLSHPWFWKPKIKMPSNGPYR